MAVDLDDFVELGKPQNKGCWFARLSPEQQEKVAAAHEEGYSQNTISKVLTKWGRPASRPRIGVHFAKECACARDE